MIKDSINKYIEENLSEKRKIHTKGVVDMALKLGTLYGANLEKVELAALSHDMYRNIDKKDLKKYVKAFNLNERYAENVNLAHSKIAALMLEKEYGIKDKDILNAVSYHTTGRENMSLLEKIIFIADAVEMGRDYPGVRELRELALKDLDLAVLASMERTVDFVRSKGQIVDEDTLKAIAYLKNNKEKLNG